MDGIRQMSLVDIPDEEASRQSDDKEVLQRAYQNLASQFDAEEGGRGGSAQVSYAGDLAVFASAIPFAQVTSRHGNLLFLRSTKSWRGVSTIISVGDLPATR